ncbi:hypothetical protein KBC75_01035 [Candidatus Shapirobacteria bacterium]|nr:hypothetical protein [Candidatus Shapirobacteria bacterium]
MKFHWHHLFVPHEHNNHRAWLLQPYAIGLFIAVYLLNQSFIKSLTIIRPGVLGYSSEITPQKVFDDTNIEREKQGLPALKYNPALSVSATKKAQDMFRNNYWAHTSPTGTTPWDFFKAENYQYSVAGENLAKDFYDTDGMMKAWMNSPTHRANIVSGKYLEIGIGVVNGILNGVQTTLVVQHFATPLAIIGNEPAPTDYQRASQFLANQKVLADTSVGRPIISPLKISQIIGVIMFVIIIGTLIVDAYVSLTRQTPRLTGSSYGHVGYLFIILILLIASRQGIIF